MLSYDSRSTLIRLDHRKKFGREVDVWFSFQFPCSSIWKKDPVWQPRISSLRQIYPSDILSASQSYCYRLFSLLPYDNRSTLLQLGCRNILGWVEEKISPSPSKFFSALQPYCSCLSVVFLSYDSRSTLIQLDRRKKLVEACMHAHSKRSVFCFL